MLAVPVFNMQGERTGELTIAVEALGGEVRPALLKQAVVAHLDRRRQRSARTKGRSDVVGSTRKLYRQKGTGNARAGSIRTPVRRGGGRAFANRGGQSTKGFPKHMRRLARQSAILAKILSEDVMIVDGLEMDAPKTRTMVSMLLGGSAAITAMLAALGADNGCVLAMDGPSENVYLSARNIPKTEVRRVHEIHVYEILRRRKLIFTKPAFARLVDDPLCLGAGTSGD